MALKDVAPVLAKDLVFVRIDTDRMVGGENLLKRLNNGKNDGIPLPKGWPRRDSLRRPQDARVGPAPACASPQLYPD